MGTPVAPLKVGVVTPGGQGWDDFEARLAMTPWAWDLRVLNPLAHLGKHLQCGQRFGDLFHKKIWRRHAILPPPRINRPDLRLGLG